MIFDTKQSSIKSFFMERFNEEQYLDITKTSYVWVAQDMRSIFSSCPIHWNGFWKLHKLNAVVYLKVYFNNIFVSHLESMHAIYLFKCTRELGTYSDL